MAERDRKRWNEKYAAHRLKTGEGGTPAELLADAWLVEICTENGARFEPDSKPPCALDLACGLGHNATWLASQGWNVDAVDISETGLQFAKEAAEAHCVNVEWIQADLEEWVPPENAYDLIVVFRFLDRVSLPRIVHRALRPGGWLIFETFDQAHCDRNDGHIKNRAFTLLPGELESIFPDLVVKTYRVDVLADRTVQRYAGMKQSEPIQKLTS